MLQTRPCYAVSGLVSTLAMVVLLAACGQSPPKPEVTQSPPGTEILARLRPHITGTEVFGTGANVTWELDRKRSDVIRGYEVYVSATAGLSGLASGDEKLAEALYNSSTYPGDTDGDIRSESITIERLTMGTPYFVHIRTAFPNGQTSVPSEETRIVPRPRGTFTLNPRLSGGDEGFSFAADTVVDWTGIQNDVYIYVVRDTAYLASPSRLNGELRESRFVDLGVSESLDDYPRMPAADGETKIVLAERRGVGVRLNDGRVAKLRVVRIDRDADPLRVTFEYLYQPVAGEIEF